MIIPVHALFSHNKMIGSKIIAQGTKHLAPGESKCSHVALLVNNRWVHEATMKSGVRVLSYDLWSKINEEVARMELNPREYQEVADLFRDIMGRKYDWPGILFLGLCIIGTFFGLKLPEKNKWESKNKYFCCEVLAYLTNRCYSMMAPIQILRSLRAK